MTPERWQQVRYLFEGALEREPAQREAFLIGACGGDDELRAAAQELLRAHHQAGTFIERPALEILAQPEKADRDVDDYCTAALPAGLEGQLIGPYRLLRQLGQGGMGTVYLAARDDGEYHKQVAIKLMRPELDERQRARFRRERQILADLEHPNIARLLDGGTTRDGAPYVVMEFVAGRNLRQMIAEQGALPLGQVIAIAQQMCAGVGAAHQTGIVHRDLKPENIIVSERGGTWTVKVLDFGIAKFTAPGVATNMTGSGGGVLVGTVAYMSPEQAAGAPSSQIDARADIYALGLIVYEMLTGQAAFQADSWLGLLQQHREAMPPPPHQLRPELNIPPVFSRVVLKALAKDRAGRQQTAEQLAAELTESVQPFSNVTMPNAPHNALRAYQWRRWRPIGLALLLFGLAIAAWSLYAGLRKPPALSHIAQQPTTAPALSIKGLLQYRLHPVTAAKGNCALSPRPSNGETLSAENLIRTDQCAYFEFTLERAGTLYLLYETNDGDMLWLNPTTAGTAPLGQAKQTLFVPEQLQLRIDGKPGLEKFWLVFVPQGASWSLAEAAGEKLSVVPPDKALKFSHVIIPRPAATRLLAQLNQMTALLSRTLTRTGAIITYELSSVADNQTAVDKIELNHLQ